MARDSMASPPGKKIDLRTDSESIALQQLAARWAEAFPSPAGDSRDAALRRFRSAYEYLDAVTHGVQPPEPPTA